MPKLKKHFFSPASSKGMEKRKKSTFASNQKGFSLIEILTAISVYGIFAVIAGGTLAGVFMALNLSKVVRDKSQLYGVLSQTLGDRTSCINNLKPTGATLPDNTATIKQGLYGTNRAKGLGDLSELNIYTGSSATKKGTLISVGDNFGENLKIIKLSLEQTKKDKETTPVPTPQTALNNLVVREFKVYYEHRKGNFKTKGGTCDATDANKGNCYSISCESVSYQTDSTGVTTCTASCDPVIPSGGGGSGEIKCADGTSAVKVTPDGRTLFGCGTTQANLHNTTALGFNAGNSGAGTENTFIGFEAGKATTNRANTFIGYRTGIANITGDNNTFLGLNTGERNTTGHGNTFLGSTVGTYNTTGVRNTFVGIYAGASNTTGINNTFIGAGAGNSSLDTDRNTHIGRNAGHCFAKGADNIFIGQETAFGRTTNNTWSCPDGTDSKGDKNQNTGSRNVAIGTNAVWGLKSGSNNVFIGHRAGYNGVHTTTTNVITGGDNVVIGYQSGSSLTGGSKNTFLGFESGKANTTAGNNTFLGYQAGKANNTGTTNLFIGDRAGQSNTTGAGNIFIGSESGGASTTADHNLFIGGSTGKENTGYDNICLGTSACQHGRGNKNVIIGRAAGYILNKTTKTPVADNNIFIGHEASKTNAGGISETGSRQLNIGNLLFGKTPSSNPTTNFFADTTAGNQYLEGSTSGLVVNGDLYISGGLFGCSSPTVCTRILTAPVNNISSRVFKNTITLFKNYQYALSVINNTPLFNYYYNKDHPKHKRMGIISEDLPKHLQIQDKGKPITPDWVSIYGTLWAGIKALYNRFISFKKEVTQKFASILNDLKKLIHNTKELKKEIESLKKENIRIREQITSLNKKIEAK